MNQCMTAMPNCLSTTVFCQCHTDTPQKRKSLQQQQPQSHGQVILTSSMNESIINMTQSPLLSDVPTLRINLYRWPLPQTQVAVFPYNIHRISVLSSMLHCVNAKAFNHSELRVTLNDLVETLYPTVTVERCAYVLNKNFNITLYKGNFGQLGVLQKNNHLRSVYPEFTKMAKFLDVFPLVQLLNKYLTSPEDEDILIESKVPRTSDKRWLSTRIQQKPIRLVKANDEVAGEEARRADIESTAVGTPAKSRPGTRKRRKPIRLVEASDEVAGEEAGRPDIELTAVGTPAESRPGTKKRRKPIRLFGARDEVGGGDARPDIESAAAAAGTLSKRLHSTRTLRKPTRLVEDSHEVHVMEARRPDMESGTVAGTLAKIHHSTRTRRKPTRLDEAIV